MRLQLTQYDTTVTIEKEGDGHTVDDMVQFFRQLLEGQGYMEEQVLEAMPTEEAVSDMIEGAIKEHIAEEKVERNVDSDEGLTEYRP
jgi:cupin superfamily acireductone dioxygenase involved in methionine salvage